MGLQAHPLLTHVRLLLLQDPASLYRSLESLPIATSKGPVGYLLKFDYSLIQAIAKGNSLMMMIPSQPQQQQQADS